MYVDAGIRVLPEEPFFSALFHRMEEGGLISGTASSLIERVLIDPGALKNEAAA